MVGKQPLNCQYQELIRLENDEQVHEYPLTYFLHKPLAYHAQRILDRLRTISVLQATFLPAVSAVCKVLPVS
jgi:hypothetical protein